MRRKTHEEFVKDVYNKYSDEYNVLGQYKNSQIKIKMKHNKCGFEYDVKPNDVLNGVRCPDCYRKKKKTTSQYKKEVYELVKGEFEILGEYVNSKSKIKTRHSKCGYIFRTTPNCFLRNGRPIKCPKCNRRERYTTEIFKERIYEKYGDEYTLIGEYNSAKVTIRHNICSKEHKVSSSSFLGGRGCFDCYGNKAKTTDQFKQRVFELVEEEYEVLGEYKNNRIKIKMKHNTCSHEYSVTPDAFIGGNRCPNCRESKGERIIKRWLDANLIKYEIQKKFKNCRYKKVLPFDFAIFQDDMLLMLLEYDGRQHFEPAMIYGGEEEFKATTMRDSIKNSYCIANSIPLLRISYSEFDNIDAILEIIFSSEIKTGITHVGKEYEHKKTPSKLHSSDKV